MSEESCCCGSAPAESSCCGSTETTSCCDAQAPSSCCESGSASSSASGTKESFMGFMGNVFSEGAIPLRSKELIAISLSLLAKCEPCLKIHVKKARALGISEDEINEAVWMAIGFGGAPMMMYYESLKNSL
ncbi:MAG: carboxymuconolactone decarboxylase family protein [Armatimonadota bacterium]